MKTPRKTLAPRLGTFLLLLILLAPSAWMIATIPPLWRDLDAYVQLTEEPRLATYWGHAPAYCYIARIPLLLGEQWDRIRGQTPPARILESQPALTDSGIWLLIVTQHLGLCFAGLRFVAAVSRRFWIRLLLVLIWASCALFYTFAHCLGSETLGMILIILLAAQAIRLVQTAAEPLWHDWYLFCILLLLCLLSRDLNLGLIALLPTAFVASWILTLGTKDRRDLQNAGIAIVLSVVCVALTDSVKHDLARKSRFHPHSRIGFTFLWRLHFLQDLSPESRAALLQKVHARAESDAVRHLITLRDQMHREGADVWNTGPFLDRAIPYFGGPLHWEDLDRALNQMAFAFLWPPLPELLRAARADFIAGMRAPPTLVSDYLFETTSFYYQHKSEMPAAAGLVTFRDPANEVLLQQLPLRHRYFRLWQPVSYLFALITWGVVLGALVLGSRRRHVLVGPTIALAVALTSIGLLLFAASCVLHDFEPRLALSLWQLLLLSLLLLLGKTADLFLSNEGGEVRRAAVRSEP